MKEALKKFMGRMEKDSYYSPQEGEEPTKMPKHLERSWEYVIGKFKTRRSIRKYSQKEIDWKCTYEIIDAALNAPCAGNIQNTKIIIIKDVNTINEIARAENQQYWVADAPILLAIVRDESKLVELYPGHGHKYSIQNAAAVIQNVLMLAHFHDFGACWVESCESKVLNNILNVPHMQVIDAIIPIGFPMENPEVIKLPTPDRIYFEKFGNRKRK